MPDVKLFYENKITAMEADICSLLAKVNALTLEKEKAPSDRDTSSVTGLPPQQAGIPGVNQVRSTLVHVHKELEEKRRRSANVIVHGLEPQEGISDDIAVSNFMESNLTVKTSFQKDKCRRLGKKVSGKIQPLLVVFSSTISAADVLACSSGLRRSSPNVYLNPNLTRADRGSTCLRRAYQ
jgi:hypothetical protein